MSETTPKADLVPTTSDERHPRVHVERFQAMWHRIGFGAGEFDRLVVTPACGLATLSPKDAVRIQRLASEAAAMLGENAN